jgi:predicted Rossmann fold nucleotide-binding protein DprA/Smf involved in DNA uptake
VGAQNHSPHTVEAIGRIEKGEPQYPTALHRYLGSEAPDVLTTMGNLALIERAKLAIFCSADCSPEIANQAYALLQKLAEPTTAVIGGFHSPVERECLDILMRSSKPVIIAPARSLVKLRIRREHREPLESGRLLYLSFFRSHRHRSDVDMASKRNHFVAALADKILIPFAAPGSKTEQLCRELIRWGKPVFAIDDTVNQNLLELGVAPMIGLRNEL